MATLRLVLGDQLTRDLSALEGADPSRDVILMAEVATEATYVPHHKKKLVFFFAAMRHFRDALTGAGFRVRYRCLDDPENKGSLMGEVSAALKETNCDRVVLTAPGEWRLRAEVDRWAEALGCPVEVRADGRFLISEDGFRDWAEGRKSYLMETFYRGLRRETGLLMTADGTPEGGTWNFDKQNRKRLPTSMLLPEMLSFSKDCITEDVIGLVEDRFPDNMGGAADFSLAVTREDAEAALDDFIEHRLIHFGDYQDALASGQATLYHSRLSTYLNAGLLDPLAVCRRAEEAHKAGAAPLNAVEGFIRQILGWREYVRGIYWLKMPGYAETNFFSADRPLPAFYWSGETEMACVADVVATTAREAYAHHIQRLMVTGLFALLAGLKPADVEEWYLAVYSDALEWVELPNTHGMALYADGGLLASKPYAASGAYINRMSDHCAGCRYDVKKRTGPDACPFNALYWAFLDRHQEKLRPNHRMGMVYRNLDRLEEDEVSAIKAQAERTLDALP